MSACPTLHVSGKSLRLLQKPFGTRRALLAPFHPDTAMAGIEPVSSLQLVLLGDMMLGRIVNDSFASDVNRKVASFGDVMPLLQQHHCSTVVAGNLECAGAAK